MNFFKRLSENNTFAVLCILLVMFIFGLSFMFSRIALYSVSVFSLLSWRFFIAFFLMTLLRIIGVLKIELKGFPIPLLRIGLFFPILYFPLETLGIAWTSVAETGVIIATFPLVSTILAVFFLREYPTRLQALSIVLSVLGVVVIVLSQSALSATFSIPGYLALFGTVISAALFYIFSRSAPGYSSAAKSYIMMGMGFFVFTIAALVEHARNGTVIEWLSLPFQDSTFFITILYLGVLASVIGSLAQNFCIVRLGVHRSSAFSGVATVITVLAGVLLLREPFTWAQGVGTVMILLGVTGVNQFGRKS
jgi:drug/metabolite transporter (DMT)-like permease